MACESGSGFCRWVRSRYADADLKNFRSLEYIRQNVTYLTMPRFEPKPPHALATVLWAACWFATPLGPLSYVGAFAPFLLAPLFWKRSRAWAVTYAMINPIVLATIFPVVSYFKGTAALGFHGLPQMTSYNLDRDTRLPKRGGGCIVMGNEWLTDGWNNGVLRALVKILGPMRGSPQGPYPSESELTAKWEGDQTVPAADLEKEQVLVSGKVRNVPGAAKIIQHFASWYYIGAPSDTHVEAKDFGDDSFAMRFTSTAEGEEPGAITVLYGGQSTRLMGYFTAPGSKPRGPRIMPVLPGR